MRGISKRKRVSLLSLWQLQCLSHWDGVQRCDARQPCTACIEVDGGLDCVYEREREVQRMRDKLPAGVQPFLSSFKCEPEPCDPLSSQATDEGSCLSATDLVSPDANSLISSSVGSALSLVSLGSSRCLDSPAPQERSGPETQGVHSREDFLRLHQPENTPTFSFLSPLHLLSVPRPLDVSFPLMNPECFQISDTTSSELDLTLYILLSFTVQFRSHGN